MANLFELNAKQWAGVVGILALCGVGVYFYQQHQETKEDQARVELFKVQKVFEEEWKAIPEAEKNTRLDVDVKLSKTVSALKNIVEKTKPTDRVVFEAAFKLGTLYVDHGKTDSAIDALKKAEAVAQTAFQKATVAYTLGSLYLQAQKFEEASKVFEKAISQKLDGLLAEFYLSMIKAKMGMNQKEQAKPYLEKLNKEFPNSSQTTQAQSLL